MKNIRYIMLLMLFMIHEGNCHAQINFDEIAVTSFAVSGSNIFAGAGSDGIFLSSDNGASWAPVNSGLTGHKFINSFAVIDTNIFAGTEGDGVFLSTDNCASWTPVNSGLTSYPRPPNYIPNVNCFAVADTNIFAGTDDGLFLSTNNGMRWTNLGMRVVSSLAVSGTTIFAGTDRGRIILFTNNGANWSEVNTGISKNNVIISLAVNGTNIFAGTNEGGIFLSTNNGASWAPVNTGLTCNFVYCLAVSGTNIFAGTLGGGIFLSTNNGASWTPVGQTNNKGIYALAVIGTNLFALDGGRIWQRPLSELITEVEQERPETFSLEQNYPNPFNPATTISFTLPEPSQATLTIHDVLGRTVRTLIDEPLAAGAHQMVWDGCDESGNRMAGGIYFYKLKAGNAVQTNRMLLVK
jgi:photosystem II stability/assembly factor-like uncharacterized protein